MHISLLVFCQVAVVHEKEVQNILVVTKLSKLSCFLGLSLSVYMCMYIYTHTLVFCQVAVMDEGEAQTILGVTKDSDLKQQVNRQLVDLGVGPDNIPLLVKVLSSMFFCFCFLVVCLLAWLICLLVGWFAGWFVGWFVVLLVCLPCLECTCYVGSFDGMAYRALLLDYEAVLHPLH